jgi:hypothetical protein
LISAQRQSRVRVLTGVVGLDAFGLGPTPPVSQQALAQL